MSERNLYQTEQTAGDGSVARFVYDPEADMLEIFFGENQPATGVELTGDIILRLNRQTRQPPQPDVVYFSILTEQTEYGPRSFPLHGPLNDPLNEMEEAPEELRELALHLATTKSVTHS